MKILYVDAVLEGHHVTYMSALVNDNGSRNNIVVVPENVNECSCKQYYYPKYTIKKGFLDYIKWLIYIKKIAKQEKADIIHFLYGDLFYQYFGIGLSIFKGIRTIITFHQFRRGGMKGKVKDTILKHIMRRTKQGVVHTESLMLELKKLGIQNITHIEYPKFYHYENISKSKARDYFSIKPNVPVLGFIGIITEYKGFDILLEALKEVHQPFHLLIAGKPDSFDSDYIIQHTKTYSGKVTMILKYLTDKEFAMSLHACDIVVLPYKRFFDGASGPLCEGVWLKNTIIGSNHGSLGYTIEKNNLGVTFETENAKDLTRAIEDVLSGKYRWNEKTEKYRLSLMPERFLMDYRRLYDEVLSLQHNEKNYAGGEEFEQ